MPRSAQQRTHERRCPARQLDVRPPHLEHVRLPRRFGGERRRDPVRVHEVGVSRRRAGGPGVRREECRNERDLPRRSPQVLSDPTAVGDTEVLEGRRGHDVDLDPELAHTAHLRGDEASRDVTLVARVRRREDADMHDFYCVRT